MDSSTFGFAKPEDSPGFSLWKATVVWQRLINSALSEHEISHAQFVVMAAVLWFTERQKEPTQVLIANMTRLDKMTVSKSLKKLAAEDIVQRFENEQDTRAKTVKLTSKGKAIIKKLVPIVEQIDEKFFGVLSDRDRTAIIGMLNKLVAD